MIRFLISCILLFPMAMSVPAQSLNESVDRVAREQIEKQKLVGLGVGIVHEGKVVHLRGYGHEDREAGIAVDPKKTQFRWASCSKSVTAIAALQLFEQGKLDLDADIRKYVPEFPDKGVKITSRQLLCHQGGIVHYTNGKVVVTKAEYKAAHPFEDVVTALDTFKESPLVNQPGEKFSYTTHGYILLSAVVQRAGGEPFAEQVRKRISEPLDMKQFQPDYHWKPIPHRAIGYLKRGEEIARRASDRDPDVSWKLGGGGYTSTVEDFAKFAAGIANHSLAKLETERAMSEHQKLANGKPAATPYGLGFALGGTPGGIKWIGHSGAQEKTRTAFLVDLKGKRAVVVMTNSEYATPMPIATALLDAVK